MDVKDKVLCSRSHPPIAARAMSENDRENGPGPENAGGLLDIDDAGPEDVDGIPGFMTPAGRAGRDTDGSDPSMVLGDSPSIDLLTALSPSAAALAASSQPPSQELPSEPPAATEVELHPAPSQSAVPLSSPGLSINLPSLLDDDVTTSAANGASALAVDRQVDGVSNTAMQASADAIHGFDSVAALGATPGESVGGGDADVEDSAASSPDRPALHDLIVPASPDGDDVGVLRVSALPRPHPAPAICTHAHLPALCSKSCSYDR